MFLFAVPCVLSLSLSLSKIPLFGLDESEGS